jgi:hypothetical protein
MLKILSNFPLEEFENIWLIHSNPNPATDHFATGKKLIGVRNAVD